MYLEMLGDCKDATTWHKVTEPLDEMRIRLNVDNYVLIYKDDRFALKRSAAYLGGWKSRQMVDRYAKYSTEHLAAAAGRIENGRGGTVVQLSRFRHVQDRAA